MSRAYLIVQKVSFDHIAYVTKYILNTLSKNFGSETNLIVCDQIDDAEHADGAIVFVIGEGFKPHKRRPGCTYVYLNFSIVLMMGNPLQTSKVGWSAIRRKRRMLEEKQSGFDILLDYFPLQTKRLQQQLHRPVFGFDVGVDPSAIQTSIPLHERPFDVCFVGAMTPRRQKVIDQLRLFDLQISPTHGVVYEEIAAQSRCCINIHAFRSNHLETPRIIGALAAATPVITEPSYGSLSLIPNDLLTTTRLSSLAKTVAMLCKEPDKLADQQRRAQHWYNQIYLTRCRGAWSDLSLKILEVAKCNAR